MVPRANVTQLKEAVTLANYLLFDYMEHEESVHVIVVGPQGNARRSCVRCSIRPVSAPCPSRRSCSMNRNGYAPNWTPGASRSWNSSCTAENEEISLRQRTPERPRTARNTLIMAEPFVRIDTAARSAGHLSIISGWIPARDIDRTNKALDKTLTNPFRLDARRPSRRRALRWCRVTCRTTG